VLEDRRLRLHNAKLTPNVIEHQLSDLPICECSHSPVQHSRRQQGTDPLHEAISRFPKPPLRLDQAANCWFSLVRHSRNIQTTFRNRLFIELEICRKSSISRPRLYISGMGTDDQSMTEAMDAWITARKKFLANRRDGLDAYCTANLKLLAAFAADCNADDPTMFTKAYHSLRARLIADANRQSAKPSCNGARVCDEA
jgi:hypothetical protein